MEILYDVCNDKISKIISELLSDKKYNIISQIPTNA